MLHIRNLLIIGCICTYMHGADISTYNRLRTRYHLFTADDYRAAVNARDLLEHKDAPKIDFIKYDACALALGYKNVMECNPQALAVILEEEPDLNAALCSQDIYYAHADTHHTYLLYKEKGRHNALLLLNATVRSISMLRDAFDVLKGTILGYPHTDIAFYFQRDDFRRNTGSYPEDNTTTKQQFYQFLHKEWPAYYKASFDNAQAEADAIKQQYTCTQCLEQKLHNRDQTRCSVHARKDTTHTPSNITYDIPLHEILTQYKPSN